jgi:hypothetical protein
MHWLEEDVVERALTAACMVPYWPVDGDFLTTRHPEGGVVRLAARAAVARLNPTRNNFMVHEIKQHLRPSIAICGILLGQTGRYKYFRPIEIVCQNRQDCLCGQLAIQRAEVVLLEHINRDCWMRRKYKLDGEIAPRFLVKVEREDLTWSNVSE